MLNICKKKWNKGCKSQYIKNKSPKIGTLKCYVNRKPKPNQIKSDNIIICCCGWWLLYFVMYERVALPHRFMSEFDFRPLKFKLLPFATEIRDIVRPRSTVGSANIKTTRHTNMANVSNEVDVIVFMCLFCICVNKKKPSSWQRWSANPRTIHLII